MNPRYMITVERDEIEGLETGMLMAYIVDELRDHDVDPAEITNFRVGLLQTEYANRMEYVMDWVDVD